MRIAFDLDDTLIPTSEFACGSTVASFPLSLFFQERLRNGAVELLKAISKKHELWIYTTSYRKPFYIKSWFRFLGIKLNYVINQTIHEKAVKTNIHYSRYSKAPKLFGIDLLVDDLPGVGIECKNQSCNYIIVHPSDEHWVEKIHHKISL
jgi:hypothetical protein